MNVMGFTGFNIDLSEANSIVASDLEGTLTAGVTWQGMRDYLLSYGAAWPYRRFFFRQLPSLVRFRLGLGDERAFKEQWILKLLRLFAGAKRDEFDAMARWVVSRELWPARRLAVIDELQRHAAAGHAIVILTGLFQPILDAFLARLAATGLQAAGIGTPLRIEGDRFTGEIEGMLGVGDRKVSHLQSLLAGRRLVAAYGDTRRDIPMLELAAEAVAVHPDRVLRETAGARGWRILEGAG
jgi:phosphoserine phosphatase